MLPRPCSCVRMPSVHASAAVRPCLFIQHAALSITQTNPLRFVNGPDWPMNRARRSWRARREPPAAPSWRRHGPAATCPERIAPVCRASAAASVSAGGSPAAMPAFIRLSNAAMFALRRSRRSRRSAASGRRPACRILDPRRARVEEPAHHVGPPGHLTGHDPAGTVALGFRGRGGHGASSWSRCAAPAALPGAGARASGRRWCERERTCPVEGGGVRVRSPGRREAGPLLDWSIPHVSPFGFRLSPLSPLSRSAGPAWKLSSSRTPRRAAS